MKFLSAVAAFAIGSSSATVLRHDVHSQLHVSKRDVNGSYIPATAPFDNIFADISTREAESIYAFLKRQQNVTL